VLIASRSTKVTKLATTLAGYREILGLPLPTPVAPVEGSALVRQLATSTGAQAYLELTAGRPVGLDLRLPARVVVSEAFGFDPRGRSADGLELYEMPPPDYLVHLAGERRFDLVLVAGAPGVDVAAWIEAARRHAPGATWLVTAESDELITSLGRTRRVTEGGTTWTVVEADT
jgi:hypothetical protein